MIMPLRSVSDLYPYSDFSQHPGLPVRHRGLVFLCASALAEEQIKAEVLSQSSVSWDGGAFQYLKETPEITIL